jgi:hypothetical protein
MIQVYCFLAAVIAVQESPPVLSSLANDPARDTSLRRDCVLQLFRRHVKPGMRLTDVARLLDHPTWLTRGTYSHQLVIHGPERHPTVRRSTYDIRVFPELGREMGWIKLEGKPQPRCRGGNLVAVLNGEGEEADGDEEIVDLWVVSGR